jgi:P-type conjugative transfer protein TrbJ
VSFSRHIAASASVLALLAVGAPARALIVFDPAVYGQAVSQVSQGLAQVQALQRQIAALRTDVTQPLAQINGQAQSILQQAQGIGFNSGTTANAFQTLYPTSASGLTGAQIAIAQAAWSQATQQALQTAIATQTAAAQSQKTTSSAARGAVAASQGAVGQTQVGQATNQLLATVSAQLAQLEAILTTQARAQESLAAQQLSDSAAANATLDQQGKLMNGAPVPSPPGVINTSTF